MAGMSAAAGATTASTAVAITEPTRTQPSIVTRRMARWSQAVTSRANAS